MKHLEVVLDYVDDKVLSSYDAMVKRVENAHETLLNKSGKGNDFLGWVDLPKTIDTDLDRIEQVGNELKNTADILLVIGIGGSYLGAKAVTQGLDQYFDNSGMEIVFAGHHMSAAYLAELKTYLQDKRFAINVISKSGTTTEPAIAFRMFRVLLEERYGKAGAAKRIVATTDARKGALRKLADQEGYECFVIADDIGGRYSVFSPVGLLPVYCAGHDIRALVKGASDSYDAFHVKKETEDLYRYVSTRNLLYENGKHIEMLVNYEPKLHYVGEWWKQLFGESEGKEHKGIFVASGAFTTDLHSLGQYLQEGKRVMFESVIDIVEPLDDTTILIDRENVDGLNYLAGKSVDTINKKAMLATLLAHYEGGTSSILLRLKRLDAYHLGVLLYFYEVACALSGYVLGVNPFDQPGVEAYKKNMFALLEKPGFEAETKAIYKKLKK